MKKEITNEIAEWGQLHQDFCDINNEERYECGCSCGIQTLVNNVIEKVVEFISHDMNCKDEKQRKGVVKGYLEHYFNLE